MALRPVLQFPDPLLKRVARPIEKITDEIRVLAQDMLEVMYDEPGIGLAAPQVGESVRLIVMDTEWKDDEGEAAGDRSPIVLLNPQIVHREGTVVWNEACLSVPEFSAEVERSAQVRVRGLDLDGKEYVEEADGLRAVCFQHEIDHLDGVLFIDRISRLKRSLYIGKRKKALRLEQEAEGAR
jgi:peptide deformylase